jgi:hypothetical protein
MFKKFQDGFQMTETLQILVSADDVNLLSKNANTKRKNTEALTR